MSKIPMSQIPNHKLVQPWRDSKGEKFQIKNPKIQTCHASAGFQNCPAVAGFQNPKPVAAKGVPESLKNGTPNAKSKKIPYRHF
ncbi:MAG: hypothetical protein MUF24_02325 [Chitinophagaceae bacterium]|jgi:hypothetical protein|nr:hypothetical protein [Chitinophagaceae bacterium]